MPDTDTQLRGAATRSRRKHPKHAGKPPINIPKLKPIVLDAVTDMLMTDQGMTRPPTKAAALLALIVELHNRNMAVPTRDVLKEYVANNTDGTCSVYTIDAAISTRIDEGYMKKVVETTTGNVAARHSTVSHLYLIPSKRLIDVVERAKRRS